MPWTISPAPRTLTQILTEVGTFLMSPQVSSDSTLAGAMTDWINDGLNKLRTEERWPWLLVTENVTLVAGTASYVLTTTTAKKIRHVHLLDSSNNEKSLLNYLDPKSFMDMYPDRSQSGSPCHYTVFNLNADGTIDLSVPPDAGFIASYPKLKVRILKRMGQFFSTSLTDTITTLGGGPIELESFLSWHAKALGAMNMGFTDRISYAQGRADEMWTALIRDRNREADWS